jgi:hypothetical protein
VAVSVIALAVLPAAGRAPADAVEVADEG